MKVLNRNIKINGQFKFYELLCIFYILFSMNSLFVDGSDFRVEKENTNTCLTKVNQNDTHKKFFQATGVNLHHNFLLIFNSEEKFEPSDETSEEKISEREFPLFTISSFNYNTLLSSFANFSLSLQRRITIPFYLLHHSLKIQLI